MSNAIRSLQRRKGNRGRRGLNSRGHPKGPARTPRCEPPPRLLGTPKDEDGKELPPDVSKADPGCNRCHGTGMVGVITRAGREGTIFQVCACVARGMSGEAPWLRRKGRV